MPRRKHVPSDNDNLVMNGHPLEGSGHRLVDLLVEGGNSLVDDVLGGGLGSSSSLLNRDGKMVGGRAGAHALRVWGVDGNGDLSLLDDVTLEATSRDAEGSTLSDRRDSSGTDDGRARHSQAASDAEGSECGNHFGQVYDRCVHRRFGEGWISSGREDWFQCRYLNKATKMCVERRAQEVWCRW